MKISANFLQGVTSLAPILTILFTGAVWTSSAFNDYSGCQTCHGDFLGAASVKGSIFPGGKNHEMHRSASAMATACNLCHSGSSRTPVYIGKSNGTVNNAGLGCSGCHSGPGLREHHNTRGVKTCYTCHNYEAPAPETTKPPYYGTADTKANNPENTVRAANTNENWTVGDFVGLDNDGNGLADAADYAVSPLKFLNVQLQGDNISVTVQTAGGRTNTLLAASAVNGTYIAASSPMVIPGTGVLTTNIVDLGGATNAARFYKVGR